MKAGNPLQYSCLENPMNQGVWWAIVHGVAKGRTQLSDFTHFTCFFHAIERLSPSDRECFLLDMLLQKP